MSQEIQVLQCFSCDTFQSQIVKKSTKWECKMCGEKQSTRKVFGQGSGKDCRIHVQRMNELQKTKKERVETYSGVGLDPESMPPHDKGPAIRDTSMPGSSKWSKYLTPQKDNSDSDENESFPQVSASTTPEPFQRPPVKKQKLNVEQNIPGFSCYVSNGSVNDKPPNCPYDSDVSYSCPESAGAIRTEYEKQGSKKSNFDLYNLIDFGFTQPSQEVRNSHDLPQWDTKPEDSDQSSLRNEDEQMSSDFELSQISQEIKNDPEIFRWDINAKDFFPETSTEVSKEKTRSMRIETSAKFTLDHCTPVGGIVEERDSPSSQKRVAKIQMRENESTNARHGKGSFSLLDRADDEYSNEELDAILSF